MHSTALPEVLAAQAEKYLGNLDLENPEARRVFALSRYVREQAVKHRDWFLNALKGGTFAAPLNVDGISGELRERVSTLADVESIKRELRVSRNRAQLHLVWRHVLGVATLEETTSAVSDLADAMIDIALQCAGRIEGQRFGTPVGEISGKPQHLVVLALGKLGARELNLSSDIDLILAYPEPGHTDKGQTNQQFFVRVAQRLNDLLHPVTVDGFVFRVDLRLRPFGDSGPLVMHFDAIEAYYETQGRDWERYALIKARAAAGDRVAGEQLLATLRPFVYRRYLDFGAIDALREMKARLLRERKDPDDVKLGPGGIRDVEFAAQVQQMIWGGRVRELQVPALLKVLGRLVTLGRITDAEHQQVHAAYRFLRDTEHSLQAWFDEQTQCIPADAERQLILAHTMGFTDVEAFRSALNVHRVVAAKFFESAVEGPAEDNAAVDLWQSLSADTLRANGFGEADALCDVLQALQASRDRPSVAREGRERLDKLMPLVINELKTHRDPVLVAERLATVLRKVLRRSAYLVLLSENPHALKMVVTLIGECRWITEELKRQPMFLDLLLDQRFVSRVPTKAELRAELEARINEVAPEDEERLLDVLREFREQHVFSVAVAEVRGTLPLMNVSDYLTFLAEAVLEEALAIAWRVAGGPQEMPFVIVGYGKLGGIELGPGSDLDLVFIHDMPPESSQFLHRLARKLLHILTVPTYLGTLYEVDMRLRPSGNAGTMMTSMDAFLRYLPADAWTWEQQALVRARVVAGNPDLGERFETARRAFIEQQRERRALAADVVRMRERMRAHHGADDDVKKGEGGIVDIEFMVQYLALAWSSDHPSMSRYSDNVRILDASAEAGVISQELAAKLTAAYLDLRAEWHRTVLDLPDQARATAVLDRHRAVVRDAWQSLLAVHAT